MPEHIRSLAVILLLAGVAFALVKGPACAVAMTTEDFLRRRNLWFLITITAFLSHNFWVFIFLAGLLTFYGAKRETNVVSLLFFLLFAVPRIAEELPGLAGIRYIIQVDYVRLLCLTVLVPAALELRKQVAIERGSVVVADRILVCYLTLDVVLAISYGSLTGTMRHVVMVALEVALPYYVVSRSLPDLNRFRDSLMSFAIAGMLLAFIATFEFLRHWLVYSSLDNALGVDGQFSLYLLRGENLRAMASSGQPIVLGYIVGVTFGLFLYLQNSLPNRIYRFACVALLLAGAVASLSRGPWVGMVAAALVFLLSGKKVLFGLTKLALPILIAIPIVANTDFGAKVIDYLPFIGSVDEGNVGYRERLLAVSINIILDDPFFGSPSFIAEMEELRQGQGIIDLVNTFLVIALHRGLIGLGLFVAFFAVIMIGIYRLTRQPGQSEDLVLAGRALLATLAGILVTIFTVSPISFVPFVYWSIAGLGVAYIRLAEVSWKKNCQSAIGSGGNLSGIAPSPEPSGRPSGCATLPG